MNNNNKSNKSLKISIDASVYQTQSLNLAEVTALHLNHIAWENTKGRKKIYLKQNMYAKSKVYKIAAIESV